MANETNVSRKIERCYPYVLSLAAPVAVKCGWLSFSGSENLLAAGVSLGAILTGFLATNMSLVLTVNTRLMLEIRKSSYFELLLSYLREALWISLLFSAASVAGFFIPARASAFSYTWIYLAASSLLTFYRVNSIMLLLISKKD